jgi:putative pyoverdin transport system ATP-binding/permease protein
MELIGYFYRQARLFFLATICVNTLGSLSTVALMGVINRALYDIPHRATLGLSFLILCIVRISLNMRAGTSVLNLAQTVILKLRIELSRKILATSQKTLEALGKQGQLAILTQDIATLTQTSQQLITLFSHAIVFLGCFSYLTWLSWRLSVLVASSMLVGMTILSAAHKRPINDLKIMRDHMTEFFRHIKDLIDGSKELQLNDTRARHFINHVITPSAEDLKYWLTRGVTGYVFTMNAAALFYFLLIGFVLFVAPYVLRVAPQTVTGSVIILLFMFGPVGEFMRLLPILQQATIAFEKIQQLDAKLEPVIPSNVSVSCFPYHQSTQLELRGISHRYPSLPEDYPFTLGPLDLTISSGEIVFVVGGNGSGKTTLAMILTGLYAPEGGTIILNGERVTDTNREHYRQNFSAIFTDFHLFEQVFSTNSSSITQSADRYLHAFGMNDKVHIKNGRFSTIDLSYGQRKRLALVASCLEDRPIYLFDEWAADQDPSFKRRFYTELLPDLKARGKAVIAITHDEAFFFVADRVVTLEEGHLRYEVAKNGMQRLTHADPVRRKSLF